MQGRINSLESFGAVDGPGIRYVIFVKGCNFRCKFCHNPETWSCQGGTLEDVDSLLAKAERYRAYWGKEGGITVSGGEPLLQLDFVTELFEKAKKKGISTCLDTAGGPFTRNEPTFSKIEKLISVTDTVLLDIKCIDDDVHKELTGFSNKNILDFAGYLDERHVDVWIRHVLVPTITDDDSLLERLASFIKTLHNVKKVEVLPYHTLGVMKYHEMGIPYPLEGVEPPSKERVENAERILGII